MNKAEKTALGALPIIILIGVGLAMAGSRGGTAFAGVPVFAIAVALAWIRLFPSLAKRDELAPTRPASAT